MRMRVRAATPTVISGSVREAKGWHMTDLESTRAMLDSVAIAYEVKHPSDIGWLPRELGSMPSESWLLLVESTAVADWAVGNTGPFVTLVFSAKGELEEVWATGD